MTKRQMKLNALRMEYRRIARSPKPGDIARRRVLREIAKGLAA